VNAIFEDLHRGRAAIIEAVSSMCLDYEMCQNYTKTSTKFDTQWLVLGKPVITFRETPEYIYRILNLMVESWRVVKTACLEYT
jgi:hypothetical protein